MLWLHASKKKRETDKLFHYVHRKSPSPLDVNVEASFVDGSLCVNSVSTFRRYDEGDRMLLVGTTKWFVGKLVLRDYNWTVISASPEDSLHSCVVKNFYKLEIASDMPAHAALAQRAIFKSIGDKMRSFRQSMQDHLLSKFEPLAI